MSLFQTFYWSTTLIHCALLHSVCNLKAAQMNMQHSLIWELIIIEFEYTKRNQKHLSCKRWRHSWVTSWFKKFCPGRKNLDDQAKSGRPEAILQAIEANLVRNTWRVSDELLTVQCGSSPSWPQQKYPELPNCASPYQDIAKYLTHSCTLFVYQQKYQRLTLYWKY